MTRPTESRILQQKRTPSIEGGVLDKLQGDQEDSVPLLFSRLVEQLGAEVGQGRPGDQHGRDEGEQAQDTHDGDRVTGFDGTDDVGCALHDVSPMGVSRFRRRG